MKYWIVGAMFGGKFDNIEEFLLRGYWYCWDSKMTPPEEDSAGPGNSVEAQRARFKSMKKGDRIAIKKNLSITEQKIGVRAIGIIKDVDLTEWRVYVNWISTYPDGEDSSRVVDMHGCSAAVHGPFESNTEWIREIFCI